MNKILKIILKTLLPFSCQYKEFSELEFVMDEGEIMKINKDQLPDILAYVDAVFYTYIYSIVFTWFGNMIPYYTYLNLFLCLTSFYFSVFLFRYLAQKLHLLKYKNRKLYK